MSKIRLYGETSGYLELKAPAVSPDAEVEIPASFGPYGKVLQVVSTTLTTTVTISANRNVFSDVTGLSASITPSSTGSKIAVFANVMTGRDLGTSIIRVLRDSTPIFVGTSVGSRTAVSAGTRSDYGAVPTMMGSMGLDSPNTTSSVTYKIQAGNSGYTSDPVTTYINRSDTDTNNAGFQRGASSIILMEIGA